MLISRTFMLPIGEKKMNNIHNNIHLVPAQWRFVAQFY